jgi:ubiquinone/menaquinone biosynthesis C-methylase UbiE
LREAVKAFDQVADHYDDWYRHPQGRQVFEAELTALESLIPCSGVGLEVGAGTGAFAEILTGDERTIVCLDPSGAMLTRARERKIPAIMGVGERVPFTEAPLLLSYKSRRRWGEPPPSRSCSSTQTAPGAAYTGR